MHSNFPLVSVITPVYNGEKYLQECIESVLKQDYKNFEYIIVDNCSVDRTIEIAELYANIDNRIRVVNNSKFVNCEDNHNRAFLLISKFSEYCKVVSADDQITPDCLSKMVGLAEKYPEIGIVGSYQLSNGNIRWKGLPKEKDIMSGRDICRQSLLHGLDVFGNPTSVLYRSEIIRKNSPFYYHSLPHADNSACFKYLKDCSFGFVHKVLAFERVHEIRESATVAKLGMWFVADIEMLLEFGPIYLNKNEYRNSMNKLLESYYKWLGLSLLKIRSREFWKYNLSRMDELGYIIQWNKVIKGACSHFVNEIKKPNVALKKMLALISKKIAEKI